MSEPYNDEEFEVLKTGRKPMSEIEPAHLECMEIVNCLIATVESKEKYARNIYEKLFEAREQNAKLKVELDAALKRIEEYEAMEYPTLKSENDKLTKTILSLSTENENRLQEIYKLRKPSKNDRRQHDLDYAARAPERRGR